MGKKATNASAPMLSNQFCSSIWSRIDQLVLICLVSIILSSRVRLVFFLLFSGSVAVAVNNLFAAASLKCY